MKSKPVSISVSEKTAYRPPKRRRWPHRLKNRPSSSGNGRIDATTRSCASFSCLRFPITLNDTADRQLLLRSSATFLRRTRPYQTTHERPILADGALCRPVIGLQGFIRLLRYVRGRLRSISSWIPDTSPLLVALQCYSNAICEAERPAVTMSLT